MDTTEALLRGLAQDVVGKTLIEYQGETYDFGSPFARISVFDSILKFNPDIKAEDLKDLAKARKIAEGMKLQIKDSYGLGRVQIEIFEETVEHRLMNPTFITEYPTEVSPLARRNDANPFVTDRFEFFIGGREIANGFSELNDAEDQAERFMQQVADKDAGDDEAMHYDADYIRALEHGLPPTAGEGIGIDRLVMLLTDAPSIRDVILFPHMRVEVL
jgi:lysyl-tRNA synthetase class 2